MSRSADYDDIMRLVVMCCSTGPVQRKRMEVTEKLIKEQNEKGTQYNAAVTSDESSLMDTIPHHHAKHTPTISTQEG